MKFPLAEFALLSVTVSLIHTTSPAVVEMSGYFSVQAAAVRPALLGCSHDSGHGLTRALTTLEAVLNQR